MRNVQEASQPFPCVILAENGIRRIDRAMVLVMAGDRFYAAVENGGAALGGAVRGNCDVVQRSQELQQPFP